MFQLKNVVHARFSRLLIIRCLCAILLLLLVRQIALHSMLSSAPQEKRPDLVRGTHFDDRAHYTPNRGSFMCINSMEDISFDKVNDNYCDCLDSTDEPGTNACPDGTFHCTQISSNGNYPKAVHSSKVNDGICDCCDGSDEYEGKTIITNFNRQQQTDTKHFLVPCVNVC